MQGLVGSCLTACAGVGSPLNRRARARVIVIGAGFGGATAAHYLKSLAPDLDVLLIERRTRFFTGPWTNAMIAGIVAPDHIERRWSALGGASGPRCLLAEVTRIDPVTMRVTTSADASFSADRIIVSPGISMRWNLVTGLNAASSELMPHAWLGDSQVLSLRDRLRALDDGATILIGAPPNPFRCPPGPYERASLMAHALHSTGRPRCKIIIADAKDDFSKSALFKLEWDTLYPGMIEWIPRAAHGEVTRVDAARGEVWLREATRPLRPMLVSMIPAQRAADLAVRADLVDESGWCPVRAESFESTRYRGIHVIGDAASAAPIPKSAFAANSEAKLCAAAIVASLRGDAAPQARLLNTCYSLVSNDRAISVSGLYGAVSGRLTVLSEGMSPLSGSQTLRQLEARQARAWYASITADSFGTPEPR